MEQSACRWPARRLLALAVVAWVLSAACSQASRGEPRATELAADQTLSFPILSDALTLDPTRARGIQFPMLPDLGALELNLFGGLYRLDAKAHLQPDIATGMPEVSADQRTYTFHLRADARFSNGDPVHAQDFIYSWSRAAEVRNVFSPLQFIDGYQSVSSGKASTLSGLSTPDDHTLVARLAAPGGFWLASLAHRDTFVIDQKVVQARGEDTWWKTPEGLVGTGPFKMSARMPGKSLDFVPVPNWWGGSTGALRHVHVEVLNQIQDAAAPYHSGAHGLVALQVYAARYPDVRQIWNAGGRRSGWDVSPAGRAEFTYFNLNTGPFRGAEGHDGRLAFSLAIDRKAVARAACGGTDLCEPATGGLIPRGLDGYLSDGVGMNARFDPGAARDLYKRWDPDGSKTVGLTYSYPPQSPLDAAVANSLRSQWRENLGVDIGVAALGANFFSQLDKGDLALAKGGWLADYNSPQDWYGLDWMLQSVSMYRSDSFNAALARADATPFAQAGPAYDQAGRILASDVAYIPLFYYNRLTVIQPWVQGAAGYTYLDAPWTKIRIVKH